MRVAVFASGNGSNFQAIVEAQKKGLCKCSVVVLVCDNAKAGAIKRAQSLGIPVELVSADSVSQKQLFEEHIITVLKKYEVELIVLAGFMRLLSANFLKAFADKVINIHPSLLPAFKGAHAIDDAYEYGVKVTGVTVHFVDEKVDHGPIILQEPLMIHENESREDLETRIHALEHTVYPAAINLIAEGNLRIEGRKVLKG